MADAASRGKDIADAYRNWTGDDGTTVTAGGADAASNDNAASRGAAIADAYRTQSSASAAPPTSGPIPSAYGRIADAEIEAYRNSPSLLTPEATASLESTLGGKYLVSPIYKTIGGVMGLGNALMGGISQGVHELTGIPARDVTMIQQVAPFATKFGGAEPPPAAAPATPGPRFVQQYYGEGTAENPLAAAPAGPRPAFVPPSGAEAPVAAPSGSPAFVPPTGAEAPNLLKLGPDGKPLSAEQQAAASQPAGAGTTPPPAENVLEQATKGPSGRITPIVTQAQAEAEADRIIRHFTGAQTPVLNTAPLASGAQPTLSQSVQGGHAGLAALERGVRDVPEQTNYFTARETANTATRDKAVGAVIGDSRDTDVTEAALNARTEPQEKAIFDPARTQPVDTSNTVALLDQIRSGAQGERDVVANSLDHVRGKLFNTDGSMKTDPALLRGVDLSIGDMIGPKAAGTAHDGRMAAHQLMEVREALRSDMELGAPGYRDFLASQAAERSAIDGQRFLQARNITDRQGNVNLGTLDSTIKAAESQQRMHGARLADGVTDEQLNQLRALRDDYRNDAKQRMGTSIGSPTVQKFGVSGSMAAMGHPLLSGALGTGGAWLAGLNPALGMAVGGASYLLKNQSLKAQRMVMDALRDKLLNPDKARSAFTP